MLVIHVFSREGVCPLCHGGQPLWSAGSRLSDDLPQPDVSGGHHRCASEPRHCAQLRIPGAAEAAGAEPQTRTPLTHHDPLTCQAPGVSITSAFSVITNLTKCHVCVICYKKSHVYLCPNYNQYVTNDCSEFYVSRNNSAHTCPHISDILTKTMMQQHSH